MGLTGNFDESKLLVGAFAEFGSGAYDSHNDSPDAKPIEGKGKTQYVGGGLMGRFSLNTSDESNFYVDGVAHTGSAKMDYSSSDIVDYSSNAPTAYETRSGYCGLSTGFGHVNHIGDFSLNAYCRYIWTHQNGNNVILSTGKYLEVKSSSSLRLQAGLIASHKISDLLQIYLGAGYEHESNGKIEAKINGHDVESPSLSGNTGKGELGLSFLNESLSISFGVQGSVGACRGVQGKPQVAFNL